MAAGIVFGMFMVKFIEIQFLGNDRRQENEARKKAVQKVKPPKAVVSVYHKFNWWETFFVTVL
jgi:hypothetical protein